MINGRVKTGDRDLGSGFGLTDRIVATAAHVVAKHSAEEISFVTSSGIRVVVDKIQIDLKIDTALLWVGSSLAYEAPLGHASQEADWLVTAQPDSAAVRLTGTVSAVDHIMTNAGGHEMTVLQLQVQEQLKDFGGYSGSAVMADSAVIGILVEQVKERAAAVGLRRQAANVLYAVPIAKVVARFRLGGVPRAARAEALVQHLVNTAHFDMDAIKTRILTVISGREDRALAFGIAEVDMKVVVNLSAWLPTYIGEAVQKGQIAFRPELRSLETTEQYVTRYLADLDRRNVVCPVLVDGVSTAQVAELWRRVRAAGSGCRKRLILFFVGRPTDGFPEQVEVLPSPSVRSQDIADWTRHVVALRRWPSSLAKPWTTEIVSQASIRPGDDSTLDLRLTYEVLEHYIERVRLEPDTLLADLEELENRC